MTHPPRVRLLVLGLLLAGPAAQAETPIPDPPAHWVTDRAAFLTPSAASELDGRLAAYQRQTGHQVLVYLDRTTGGVPIEDWAVKAFEKWKIGRKGLDDGAALFVFSDDRKLRIEVGYGLEDRVTDALASRIINERMVPRIQAGDRDGAVRDGVTALLTAIGAPGKGQAVADSPAPGLSLGQIIFGAVVILLILGFAITHPGLAWLMLMSIGSGRGGGGFSGGGGGFSGGGGRSGGGGASGSW